MKISCLKVILMLNNKFMQIALKEANKAFSKGEVPVGCVIVHSHTGEIISKSHNLCESKNSPLMHAEINSLLAASRKFDKKYLDECDLYVTLEPCAMCAAAISMYRIKRLFYSAYDTKFGAVESGVRFFSSKNSFHTPEIYSGILEQESALLMQEFFKQLRKN